jgi:hypothetical protein
MSWLHGSSLFCYRWRKGEKNGRKAGALLLLTESGYARNRTNNHAWPLQWVVGNEAEN